MSDLPGTIRQAAMIADCIHLDLKDAEDFNRKRDSAEAARYLRSAEQRLILCHDRIAAALKELGQHG